MTIPFSDGNMQGLAQSISFSGFHGEPTNWTTVFYSAYIPETGNAWTGRHNETNLAYVDGKLLGFSYVSPLAQLRVIGSTNRYERNARDVASLLTQDFLLYSNSSKIIFRGQRYTVMFVRLFGDATVRDGIMDFEGTMIYSGMKSSKLEPLSVVGTNVLFTLQIGTNLLARVAFNKDMRPVWATTNGVFLNPVPTNSVFFENVINNRTVRTVIY